jgi:hypothetical protein
MTAFFKSSSEAEARELCPHIAAALDILKIGHGLNVEQVGWQNPKSPELVLTLDKRIPTASLEHEISDHLRIDHEGFSFQCTEHPVSVWSGR